MTDSPAGLALLLACWICLIVIGLPRLAWAAEDAPPVAAAEAPDAAPAPDPCGLEASLVLIKTGDAAAAGQSWLVAQDAYQSAGLGLQALAGRCPEGQGAIRALLAELQPKADQADGAVHRSKCLPAMDAAFAQDNRAAGLQLEKKDWAEVEKQFALAEKSWGEAAAYCKGESREQALHNQADSARARSKAASFAGQAGCEPAYGDANRMLDLAKVAWTDKQMDDAALWYRKAAFAWGQAAEKCQGSRRDQALKRKDGALVDAHNAVSCAPAWEQANQALSRAKALPANSGAEEKRLARDRTEVAWRQAALACRGAPQDTARANAETLAKERGEAPLAGGLSLPAQLAQGAKPTPTTHGIKPGLAAPGAGGAGALPLSPDKPVQPDKAIKPIEPIEPIEPLGLHKPVVSTAVDLPPRPGVPAKTTDSPAVVNPGAPPEPSAGTPKPPRQGPAELAESMPDFLNVKVGHTTFTGRFQRDANHLTLSGDGKVAWDNGDVYEGRLRHSRNEGRGTMQWANGDRYEGEWKDDLQHGQGVMRYASGDRFEGEFSGGYPQGKGRYWFAASGDRYEGEVHRGKPDGRGIYYWKNGDRFEGLWKQGDKHGRGRYIWASGEFQESVYRDNVKVDTVVNK